jgi:Cu(I)/Ag(I) efflux system membrane fusion protein
MKCESGKCSSGNSIETKKIPEKIVSEKKAPMKEDNTSSMKCESGKCSSGKETKTKVPVKQKRGVKNATIKQLFNVRTVTVKAMTTAKEQTNYGYIVAEDSAVVDVLTRYSGFVEELYADTLYKKVKAGDALASVYSPEVYKAKQDYLNSINYNMKTSMPEMLKSAKIKLELLGVCQKEIDDIAKEHYADAYTTIFAPISGWVYEKNINEGDSFTTKKRLFQIVNLDNVWMEAKLFQNELKTLGKLTDFKVTVKGLEKTFNAEKSLLYPMLDPKEATATLRLSIANKEGLLIPGMYAKLHAHATDKSRMVIPRTAAIRKSGIWYAFLATEFKGEYEPIEIKVQPLDNKYFEVTEGLRLDDIIVNNALFMMDSDAQINSIY